MQRFIYKLLLKTWHKKSLVTQIKPSFMTLEEPRTSLIPITGRAEWLESQLDSPFKALEPRAHPKPLPQSIAAPLACKQGRLLPANHFSPPSLDLVIYTFQYTSQTQTPSKLSAVHRDTDNACTNYMKSNPQKYRHHLHQWTEEMGRHQCKYTFNNIQSNKAPT